MFKYSFPSWLYLYFLFPCRTSLSMLFFVFVFSPSSWTESNTSPERMNEQVDGACFNVCFKSGKASNVCRQRQKEKGTKTSWVGINENPRPEKFQHHVKYMDLFLTLQNLNNLRWDVDKEISLIALWTSLSTIAMFLLSPYKDKILWNWTRSNIRSFLISCPRRRATSPSFPCSELGGQTAFKLRSPGAFYWLEKGNPIKSLSNELVCNYKKKREKIETLLSSVPSVVGRWKVLHIRAACQPSFSRKPVSDLKSLLWPHTQGSSRPGNTASHPDTAERIWNDPSQLSLPGDLELGLKLIPHAFHLPCLVATTELCQDSNQRLYKEHLSVPGCQVWADSSFTSLSCSSAFLFSGSKKEAAFQFYTQN